MMCMPKPAGMIHGLNLLPSRNLILGDAYMDSWLTVTVCGFNMPPTNWVAKAGKTGNWNLVIFFNSVAMI